MTDRGLTLLSLAAALAFAFCIERAGRSCPSLDDDLDGVVAVDRRALPAAIAPCATTACKRGDGGPCLDGGVVLLDQVDRAPGL